MGFFKTTGIMVALSILLLATPKQEIQVDLTDQLIYVFEDGENILTGRISSGMEGRETPTGTFKITQKNKDHVSNLWPKPNGGARMPNMMRLGSTAIALHSGRLPGYPASHGCIRVEPKVSREMFKIIKIGTTVTVFGKANHLSKHKVRKRKIRKVVSEDAVSARFDALGYYPNDIPNVYNDRW